MEIHPLASIFPLMTEGEYNRLCADMQDHGYDTRYPIIVYEDMILDGRNRWRAAQQVGVKPKFAQYTGKDPQSFVIRSNLHRRHLDAGQRAMIAARLANMGQGERTDLEHCANLRNVSQPEAAEMLNVSRRSVQHAKVLLEEEPELAEEVVAGKITLNKAMSAHKKKKRQEDIDKQKKEIANGTAQLPEGTYEVICIDPPWPYGTQYDAGGRRAASPYPEMSLEEIKNLHIPASENCVLWLWTTHKFMRHSFELLDAWGFRDVAILTWVKDKMGLGKWLRSQSEFCIMAIRGKPTINLTNETTILHGAVREHSRKPDEFYYLVDDLCIGRRLDYFSREQRLGWRSYGNDVEKFT